MTENRPYLISNRLADVIAALQFLGQYEEYKRTVKDWNRKLKTPPRSVRPESNGEDRSWGEVFRSHSEFFRIDDEGNVSLVWRRGQKKTRQGQRPPLEAETIAKLIDAAILLHGNEGAAKRAEEDRAIQHKQHRWQRALSIGTAILAFVAVVLAAWIRASIPLSPTS